MTIRKLILIGTAFVSMGTLSTAHAALPGFYVGAQLGQTDVFTHGDHIGLGGGITAGYQFIPAFAIEAQYIDFAKVADNKGSLDPYAIGVAAKGIIPIPLGQSFGFNTINLYGKLGAAYVQPDGSGSSYQSHATYRPLYGVGVSYDITPQVSTDLGWTRIQAGNGVYNSQLIGLGVTFHFA
jgi:hypothetical protein